MARETKDVVKLINIDLYKRRTLKFASLWRVKLYLMLHPSVVDSLDPNVIMIIIE